jgi:hypothetical protein
MTMKLQLCGIGLGLWLATLPAAAAGLCNCCGASTDPSCTAACAAVKLPAGQCQVTVDYAATAAIGPGVNPLYGVSLRNMDVGHPDAAQREALRSLLEKSRHSAETDRRTSWRTYERGELDATGLAETRKRYDAAIVNYFLGISAFRRAKSGP